MHAGIWAATATPPASALAARQMAAEFLSTFGLVVASTNLMLVTRARPLERGFGGLDKLFASHRADGITVACVLASHALLVVKSPGWVPAKLVSYPTITFIITWVLIASAPRTPWRRLVTLRYDSWKATHRFMGLFVAAGVTHSLLAPAIVHSIPALQAYVYAVASLGLVAYVYRELPFSRFGPTRSYRVAADRRLSDSVLEVTFEPHDPLPHQCAGQFAFVTFAEGPSAEQHPFTISCHPSKGVRFSMKASGDFTRAMLGTPPPVASSARVEGPYGRFDWRLGKKHQLWLAGGVGITPFISFAEDVDPDRVVTLVWSVREAADAFYEADLRDLAESKPNLRVSVHSTSESGHLALADLELPAPLADHSAFVCGPAPMRDAFIRQLRAAGAPRSDVFYEEFTLR